MGTYDSETVRCFLNHPTLEPAITPGNESLVEAALSEVGIARPAALTAATIDTLFHDGAGRGRKGEFAFALAAQMEEASTGGASATVPDHLNDLFDFVRPAPPTDEAEPGATPTAD
jgi:putative ATP-dependent endonuclease of OLD family